MGKCYSTNIKDEKISKVLNETISSPFISFKNSSCRAFNQFVSTSPTCIQQWTRWTYCAWQPLPPPARPSTPASARSCCCETGSEIRTYDKVPRFWIIYVCLCISYSCFFLFLSQHTYSLSPSLYLLIHIYIYIYYLQMVDCEREPMPGNLRLPSALPTSACNDKLMKAISGWS